MEPDGDLASCSRCGTSEYARRRPLFVVTGASGSGKSTVRSPLSAELTECEVFDVDWLIDPIGRVSAPGPTDWAALRDSWLHVAHGVAQSGRATVLLGTVMPEQLDELPGRRWISAVHFAVLDCSDAQRRRRLEARPPWRERAVEEHIAFAGHLRRTIPTGFTTDGSPAEAAQAIARWVRAQL